MGRSTTPAAGTLRCSRRRHQGDAAARSPRGRALKRCSRAGYNPRTSAGRGDAQLSARDTLP
eukprot:3494748-Pleurochrysis_carterae.AAC.3